METVPDSKYFAKKKKNQRLGMDECKLPTIHIIRDYELKGCIAAKKQH